MNILFFSQIFSQQIYFITTIKNLPQYSSRNSIFIYILDPVIILSCSIIICLSVCLLKGGYGAKEGNKVCLKYLSYIRTYLKKAKSVYKQIKGNKSIYLLKAVYGSNRPKEGEQNCPIIFSYIGVI